MENHTPGTSDRTRLGRLAHLTSRYRWPVIAAWLVLTIVGGVAAGKLSTRWYQSTAVPGKPAYETGQQTLKAFGAAYGRRTLSCLPLCEQRRHHHSCGARRDGAAGEGKSGSTDELVLLQRQPCLCVQ